MNFDQNGFDFDRLLETSDSFRRAHDSLLGYLSRITTNNQDFSKAKKSHVKFIDNLLERARIVAENIKTQSPKLNDILKSNFGNDEIVIKNARSKIIADEENINNALRRFLAFLRNPKDTTDGVPGLAEKILKNTGIHDQPLKDFYHIGAMYERGYEYALTGKNIRDIETRQLEIPYEAQVKIWIFMVSWMNAKFDVGLSEHEERLNGTALALLSRRYRGLESHTLDPKLKAHHNAALHSLGGCILLIDVFKKASKSFHGEKLESAKDILRDQIRSMLTHDLGEEISGETRTGGTLIGLSEEEIGDFFRARASLEEKLGKKTIDHAAHSCANFFGGSYTKTRDQALERFEAAENNDFWGIFLKAAEKLHSNLDYIRMHGIHSGVSLNRTKTQTQDFGINYVFTIFFNCSIKETSSNLKKPTDIRKERTFNINNVTVGKNNLFQLAKDLPEGEREIGKAMVEQLYKKFTYSFTKYLKASDPNFKDKVAIKALDSLKDICCGRGY